VIWCEERATAAALEHLLRESIARAPANGLVEVIGRRKGGGRSLTVRVAGAGTGESTAPGTLRIILARLLLHTQGATLTCEAGDADGWSALIVFPPK
jgi:hypothetical protein